MASAVMLKTTCHPQPPQTSRVPSPPTSSIPTGASTGLPNRTQVLILDQALWPLKLSRPFKLPHESCLGLSLTQNVRREQKEGCLMDPVPTPLRKLLMVLQPSSLVSHLKVYVMA